MKRIAILGANSQIAKSLIPLLKFFFTLDLYSRKSLKSNNKNIYFYKTNSFPKNKNIIAILNCAGPGDPGVHKKKKNIFKIFNKIDSKILQYVLQNKKIKYINISTGVVLNIKKINRFLKKSNYNYAQTKFYLEERHRLFKNLKIYDLRVFGFFSRYISYDAGFFLSQILKSIKNNKILKIDPNNKLLDYIGGYDLYIFLKKIINKNYSSGTFNLLSRRSVNKFEILRFFKKKYNLNFSIKKIKYPCENNLKRSLINKNKKVIRSIFFRPKYSSIELIKSEVKYMFGY
jgi:dTDP-4-dehydrorhamnose reductase